MSNKYPWTDEEVAILKEFWGKKSAREIGEMINKGGASVQLKASRLNLPAIKNKNWSPEEIAVLEKFWGSRSAKGIGNIIGRSEKSVRTKANKLGLGRSVENYNGFTMRMIWEAFKINHTKIQDWIRDYDFPARKDPTHRCKEHKVIKVDLFWEWAEKHQILLDCYNLAPRELGPEPDWVRVKRKKDERKYLLTKNNKKEWSDEEDRILVSMYNAKCYTRKEIAKRLLRSEGSVIVRAKLLFIDTDIPPAPRTFYDVSEEEMKEMGQMFMDHYSIEEIADKYDVCSYSLTKHLQRHGYTIDKVIEKDTEKAKELFKMPIFI